MKDRLIDLGYSAGWNIVRALPLPVAKAVFRAGADRAWKSDGPGTQRLRANLRQVVGPDMPETLVRDALRSYARYWMEAFRLPSQSREQFLDGFRMEPEWHDQIKKGVADGTGVVLALPHVANWDAAGAWVTGQDFPLITVAERFKQEKVYQQFLAYREKLGMKILPHSGGERPALDVLAEHLGKGWVVALLGDRDLSRRGIEVEFFGGRTRMPAGPAILAIRTGAPLFAVDMWYDEDRVQSRMRRVVPPTEGALDERVRKTTQLLADAYAAGIAEHPQDWHMLQKLWL
ncbi:phosphatidylinositol mannoside acyltransferase [Actinoplanes couchii]|uniref:Lipid A biosynthesis lauroyl acyltransferase n=1 Tax=Actinoplanes couchii TaxID=403638 RepID=A0ABQ3X4B6_9ACTN|nr:phosphatidylinositol mannoside acyltransferase [Actinoplanes couchii]MDR6326279.1 KDO2-lipid IV(A) lauroyltransferase [Actinoplanes couchii]GID53368.1 lipid A biosynthesis lauroyl acyltransferase [Actinoplanes couchii]